MNKLLALLLVGVIMVLACSAPVQTVKLRVIAEEFPPFNYVDEKGNVVGKSTETVRAIMNKLGQDILIEVMPWTESYTLVQKEPGVALYSTARTAERENMFQWVGPLASYENWLYARKGSGVRVSSLDQAKAVKKIAVVKNAAGHQVLAGLGFNNFEFTSSTPDGLKQLMAGNVDLWVGTMDESAFVAKKAGINPNEIEPAVLVHKIGLYIAFNKNTPQTTVQEWQKALDSLKK
jgi:polar amino acid transport system substrate-binding protein